MNRRDLRTRRAACAWALVAVTALAFALRLIGLGQGLFGDELFTYSWTAGHHLHTGNADNPPLFFVLAWLSGRIGDPAMSIRLPSLLLGTATVPLVFALGARTGGSRAGLIAAAFVALAPYSIFYGVDARPYATMLFFLTLATLALVKAAASGSARWWAAYAVATAAAAYSHFSAIFVIAVQAAWSVWVCRDRLRQPLLASAAVIAIYLPWLSHVHGHQQIDIIAYLAPLHAHTAVNDVLDVFFGGYPNASLRKVPTLPAFIALAAVIAAALSALAYRGLRAPAILKAPRREVVLLMLAAVATPIGLLLYSVLDVDIFGTRQLLASLPAFAVILGAGVMSLPRVGSVIAAAALLTAISLAAVLSLTPAHRRPDLPGAAHFIETRAVPGAAVDYVPLLAATGPLAQGLQIYLSDQRVTTVPSRAALTEQWRSAPQVFFVVPVFGRLVFAPVPPRVPDRRVATRRAFDGIVPYMVIMYR